MVWREKLKKILESPEFIELKIYRNRVREKLLTELNEKRDNMLNQGKYPYKGEWLTLDDIILSKENESKEKTTKFILILLIYLLMLISTFVMSLIIWRTVN